MNYILTMLGKLEHDGIHNSSINPLISSFVVASQQDGMPAVPIKTVEQQEIQMLHRYQERYAVERCIGSLSSYEETHSKQSRSV